MQHMLLRRRAFLIVTLGTAIPQKSHCLAYPIGTSISPWFTGLICVRAYVILGALSCISTHPFRCHTLKSRNNLQWHWGGHSSPINVVNWIMRTFAARGTSLLSDDTGMILYHHTTNWPYCCVTTWQYSSLTLQPS